MDKKKQSDRILELLSCGYWITLPEIMALHIASHTRRIHELRKAGHVIERRDYWSGSSRHVFYRLVKP